MHKHNKLTFNTLADASLASTLPDFKTTKPANKFISKIKSCPAIDVHKMLDLFIARTDSQAIMCQIQTVLV